jgi:hypothetical protein
MNGITSFSSVPGTPAEEAAASTVWERRGPLGRLVRVDARPPRRAAPSDA